MKVLSVDMRWLAVVLLASVLLSSPVFAADTIFTNFSSAQNELRRLGAEAYEVAVTPVDAQDGGIWGTLAVAGATGLTYIFDDDIRNKVRNSKSNTIDKAAKAGSFVGHPLLHLGIAAAVYGGGIVSDSPKHRDLGLMLGEAAFLADASTLVLKQAIGRARPFVGGDKGSFRPFQLSSDFDSLPSMHTASSFAMASVIAGTSESLTVKALSYATAMFVGFSRIYEDKHWASDVVLGAAVGELCGRVVMNSHVKRSASLRLAPVVSNNAVSLAVLGNW